MRTLDFLLLAFAAAAPAAPLAAQAPAADPDPARFIYATPGETYPFYAGLPRELWPFSAVEPYQRFFTTRMPFRGPGRDYPDPSGLKSLRVGLLDSAKY